MAQATKTLRFRRVERVVKETVSEQTVMLQLDHNEAEAVLYYLKRAITEGSVKEYTSLRAAGTRVKDALTEAGITSF